MPEYPDGFNDKIRYSINYFIINGNLTLKSNDSLNIEAKAPLDINIYKIQNFDIYNINNNINLLICQKEKNIK